MSAAMPTLSPATQTLIDAVVANNVPAAAQALADGADPTNGRHRALCHAASHGQLAMVELLLPTAQAHPNALARALYRAAKQDHWNVVNGLQAKGAALLPEHADYLADRCSIEALVRLGVQLTEVQRATGTRRAVARASLVELAGWLRGATPGPWVHDAAIQALSQDNPGLIALLLPWCDRAQLEEQLEAEGRHGALDRLACASTPADRIRMVQAWGTQNLPQAAKRCRVEQRAQVLTTASPGVASRPRRRS